MLESRQSIGGVEIVKLRGPCARDAGSDAVGARDAGNLVLFQSAGVGAARDQSPLPIAG